MNLLFRPLHNIGKIADIDKSGWENRDRNLLKPTSLQKKVETRANVKYFVSNIGLHLPIKPGERAKGQCNGFCNLPK